MFVLGLTGGIGSGKTTILKMFSKLGVPVYIADVEAKRLMQESDELKDEIIRQFGENSYNNKELNRSYLANIVFGNPEKLESLNKIVHPFVFRDFEDFKSRVSAEYIVYESAILLQRKNGKMCDYIVQVTAPLSVRLDRVVRRDGTSSSEIEKRMKHQVYTSEQLSMVDTEIENIDLTTSQDRVLTIHSEILGIIKKRNK